jgi:hypothetical protein
MEVERRDPLELDLIIPESFFEQPIFVAKVSSSCRLNSNDQLGKRVLKLCPDPGATTRYEYLFNSSEVGFLPSYSLVGLFKICVFYNNSKKEKVFQ